MQGCPNLFQPMSLLHKFDAIDAEELADFLIERKHILPVALLRKLADNFRLDSDDKLSALPTPAPTPNSLDDFDLKAEIMEQMFAMRALRERTTDGSLASIKETKEALSATTSLLTLLTKINGQVYNQDRIRTIQVCTIETLKDMDTALQDRFLVLLEEKLAR